MGCWSFVISVQVINEYMYKFIQLERKIQTLNSSSTDCFNTCIQSYHNAVRSHKIHNIDRYELELLIFLLSCVYFYFILLSRNISYIEDCRVFNKMIIIGNVNIFINPFCVCNDCIQIDKNSHVNSLIITLLSNEPNGRQLVFSVVYTFGRAMLFLEKYVR